MIRNFIFTKETVIPGERLQAGLFLLFAIIALSGCGKKHDPEQKVSRPTVIVSGAAVETVKSVAIPESVEVAGTVRARTSAVVSSRIPGTVSVLKVREGDRVTKGQFLLQLDARENQATAAASNAGSDDARRALDEATARMKLADVTFERFQKLFNEQAVTRQELDVRQTEKELAVQGVARAEARLKQALEGTKAAAAMADYTKIVAPISGIITSKPVDLGATVFPAQPIMIIEDEGTYQLDLAIPENMASKVKPGTSAQIVIDATGTPFSAKIAEIVPSADPASRTFTAKVNLSQKGLRSGMFGRGALSLGTTVKAMLIPKKAVFERGSLTSVWVLDKENIARMRLVKTGKSVADKLEILSGVSDGEKIVVHAVEKVSEGAKVE